MCSFLTFYLASFVNFTFIYISLSLSLRLHSFPLVCLYSNLNLFKRIIGSFSYPPTIVHYFSIYLQLANKLQLMSTTQILALLNLYLDGHVHINLLENFDWLFEKIKNKGKYERPYFKKISGAKTTYQSWGKFACKLHKSDDPRALLRHGFNDFLGPIL